MRHPRSLHIGLLLVGLTLLACKQEPRADSGAVQQDSLTQNAPVTPTGQAPAAAADQPLVAIDGEGLRVVMTTGTTRPLPFSMPWPEAIAALTTLWGAPSDQGRMEECGGGALDYVRWPNDLQIYGQENEFRGWALNGGPASGAASLTTMNGIGLGSSRQELEEAYTPEVAESTLGTEFLAGGLSGLLTSDQADARVESLWAGASCNFR